MRDLVLLVLPDWVNSQPTMYFPLAVTYLAAMARDAGYDVEILDWRQGVKVLPEAKFYGFSCVTPQINVAKEIAHTLKGLTIIGGAHPSLLPQDCRNNFDYIVRGEGEYVLLDILSGKQAPGIIMANRLRDLNMIPYPAWDMVARPFSDTLFPGERYGKGELAATLIASRGCPYNCSFCGNPHTIPVVFRSVKNIIGELMELIKRNVRYFRFEDDCFTIHPQFEQLCEGMAGLNIHYKCHTRSDLMTSEKANLMHYSGCEECGLGVESADDDVLAVNNKRETVEDHRRAIAILKAARIRVKTYFIMGLPGETDKTLALNKAFAEQTRLDKWTVSTFSPYPGSPVFRSPGKFGIEIIDKDFSHWWNFSNAYNHVIYGQTREQMWARYVEFYRWLKEDYGKPQVQEG